MQVIGSPIGSPTPSRKTSPSPTRKSASSSRKSSAASRKTKTTKTNQSAYITEIDQDEIDLSIEINAELQQPITPPATPETGSERGDMDGGRGRRFSDGAISISPIPEEKPADIIVPSMEQQSTSEEEEPPVPERSGSRIRLLSLLKYFIWKLILWLRGEN